MDNIAIQLELNSSSTVDSGANVLIDNILFLS